MPTRLPGVTATETLRALERNGWYRLRQSGSHVRLAHPSRSGRITVSVHAGTIVKPKTLSNILGQAGLSVDEFIALL